MFSLARSQILDYVLAKVQLAYTKSIGLYSPRSPHSETLTDPIKRDPRFFIITPYIRPGLHPERTLAGFQIGCRYVIGSACRSTDQNANSSFRTIIVTLRNKMSRFRNCLHSYRAEMNYSIGCYPTDFIPNTFCPQ